MARAAQATAGGLARTGLQIRGLATGAQTGLRGRFAASTAGVCSLWLFLSAVGTVGDDDGCGMLVGASMAQASFASTGLDRMVTLGPHRAAPLPWLATQSGRPRLAYRCQSPQDPGGKWR